MDVPEIDSSALIQHFGHNKQTKKQVNIHFDPTDKKSLQRMRMIKERAKHIDITLFPKIDAEGFHHIVLLGESHKIRQVLGTMHNTVKLRSHSSDVFTNTQKNAKVKTKSKKIHTPSLLRNVLQKQLGKHTRKVKL